MVLTIQIICTFHGLSNRDYPTKVLADFTPANFEITQCLDVFNSSTGQEIIFQDLIDLIFNDLMGGQVCHASKLLQ